MPTPQEILSDPNFQNLATGDQLTVMRKADPSFAALPPTEQGTVIARSRQKYLGTDKIGQAQTPKTGFVDRLKEGVSSIPSFVTSFGRMVSPISSPAEKVSGMLTVAGPNASEAVQATDKSLTPMERFGHGLASVIPFRGPMAAGVANDVAQGDYGAAGADSLMLFSPEITRGAAPIAKQFGDGFREGWEAAGTKAKSMARGANAPFRSLPEPKTAAPAPFVPIKGDLPSGRTPGGINDPRTIPEPKPASTAQKLPLWHMVRDQIVDKPADVEPIVATKTPSGRTPGGIQNQPAPATPKSRVPLWKLQTPQTTVPATETPVAQSGPVIPAQSAAELLKTAGIGIDAVEKATPEQWKLIEKHVGSSVDQKATLEQMRSMETPAEYKQRIARTHAKFNAAGQRQ